MSFLDPQSNVDQFGLREGMYVADVGAGSGFYTIAAAKAVGEKGRVFSIDVQKDLLDKIKNSAARENIFNIEIIWGDIERLGGTRLAEYSVDAVIASNILFQIEDKKTFVTEIKRILKPGGNILVVDWTSSFGGIGPQESEVIPRENVVKLFNDNGLVYVKDIVAGDNHYGIIFKKA